MFLIKGKMSLVVVNKVQNKFDSKRQIKVRNTLKFMTEISKIFRQNIDTNIIAITGSCGKTTLKELLGNVLGKISSVSISPKSYNNKFGVPLSLLNLKHSDEFGVLEVVFMDEGKIIERSSSKSFFENPKSDRAKEFINKVLLKI